MLTVKVGQTVTWTNDDDIPHTVVATDKSFKSKVLDTGESFSFTFTKAGLVPYFCSLHPHMTGKVHGHEMKGAAGADGNGIDGDVPALAHPWRPPRPTPARPIRRAGSAS